jgi:hypothetical protein
MISDAFRILCQLLEHRGNFDLCFGIFKGSYRLLHFRQQKRIKGLRIKFW